MNFKYLIYCFIITQTFTIAMFSQNNIKNYGINLTGLERYWEVNNTNYKELKKDIDKLYTLGFRDIRLPFTFYSDYNLKSKRKIVRDLRRITKHIKKKNMSLILCYFDDKVSSKTKENDVERAKKYWKYISEKLKKYHNYIYYEILNEPNLHPKEWDLFVEEIITEIRKKDKKTKILVGATNYNSIYELSRKKPLAFKNLIYIFHFYEPFLFTHQGADWVGNQNKTIDIPYPYNALIMPKMNPEILGTAGEINHRDYNIMGNKTSLQHKIEIVSSWASKHNVAIWCTEFGAINTIPNSYRCNYFNDVLSVLKEKNIKSYLWEYKGNFGIQQHKEILDCLLLF